MLVVGAGCGDASLDAPPDHHEGADDGAIESSSAALSANDSVAAVVPQTCSTNAVKGLALQLLAEIQCIKPGTLKRIDNTPGLALGAQVFPFLQTKAADALVAAQKARGTTMSINSAVRTLPQQYLLYRWYQTGRCGITLAATPGTSNHEGGIAVDINDNAGWRSAMTGKSFRWLGASDPVHYDFTGGGTVNLRGLSVEAFQRLWNRNHPTDLIAEDGDYGPATATRLAQSPSGGFAKGADCSQSKPDAGAKDGGSDAGDEPPADVPVIPDADEPSDDAAATASSGDAEQAGACAITAARPSRSAGSVAGALALAAALTVTLRRRRRAA
ncbi:MAG: N-acetylmuramoyl-L-alanine amidase [Labilithrix sp.]|nr:N-acetylmuramoyl-L-alanine amidase [Labilithrix sp.]